MCFLRWNYPDQVHGSTAGPLGSRPLSPVSPELPGFGCRWHATPAPVLLRDRAGGRRDRAPERWGREREALRGGDPDEHEVVDAHVGLLERDLERLDRSGL